jgi:hypothetical protein
MGAEQRSLRRVNNKYGCEIRAELEVAGVTYNANVADYNSLGVALDVENSKIAEGETISVVKIYYGSELICEVSNPKTISFSNEKKRMVLALESQRVQSHFVRRERAELSFSMQGSVFGTDPFTLDQMLSFRLLNISFDGFSLISSKSNRHLMPGLILWDYTIMLPGYNLVKVSFQIRNVTDTGSHLKLGCSFLKIEKSFQNEIERILLTNSNFGVAGEVIDKKLKSRIKKIKKFGSWIRIRRVTSREEFEQVLKIRFSAYQEANKVKHGQTWKDMEDEYDKHAITYAAFAGLTIAGTIRLVIREPNSKLPFEEYINWDQVSNFDPLSSAEVSRFAIDPHYQGTDLFFALFRKIIFEIGAKKINSPVCLATKKLSKYYIGIGAKPVSKAIPHPTIEGETLTLYLFDPDCIISGKMSSLGWLFVAKPALKLLWKFKFVRKPSSGISKYFLAVPELLRIALQRFFRPK